MTIKEILEFSIIHVNDYHLTVSQLIAATIILMVAKYGFQLLLKVLRKGFFSRRKVDIGRQFAIEQFLKYIIYLVCILLAMQSVGINLSLLWAGSAALMVGIGLGLQQTFMDLISGLVLLGEGSIQVGDVVEVDGVIGTIKKIGIRTSDIETRDRITIITPNSKLITDSVINWSHGDQLARFKVAVGVAYGTDINLVISLLKEVAANNEHVLQTPSPVVRFIDFGASSLDFQLLFFSTELEGIDDVKSNLRIAIDGIFRKHDISIPFPQRDLWIKNEITPTVLNGVGGKV